MRGWACFRARKVLRAGSAPLTLVPLAPMDAHSQPICIRIGPCAPNADLVSLFRRASSGTVAEIVAALKVGAPLTIGHLFGANHEEGERAILRLLAELQAREVAFEMVVRGRVETIEVFHNILERFRQISYDTRMEMELESGEPSAEAQRWATGDFEYPKNEG
jgi:hypothetical protein